MNLLYTVIGAAAGAVVVLLLTSRKGKNTGRQEELEKVTRQLEAVKAEAQVKLEKKEAEARDIKAETEKEVKGSLKQDLQKLEEERKSIEVRSKDLDKKADIIQKRQQEIEAKDREIEQIKAAFSEKEKTLKEMQSREQDTLEKISRMSPKQARERLMKQIEEEAKDEAHRLYNSIVESAKKDAKRESIEVIARAIQGNAAEVTEELTVTNVSLPDDDMKGRIIGREGRNIRALESATGVNIIIDDTPGVVSLSSFDGERREIARRALDELIKDGRIQPSRIEEIVEKIRKEVEDVVVQEGEDAAAEAGVIGLRDDEIKLLGKMRYRTSYGQNVLHHSVEVAKFAGVMAEELGLDAEFSRRAGLLHDLGKAVDREMEGTHVEIGAALAKKYGESARLQNAIMSHHGDVEPETPEAVLIQAADSISASRPGARRQQITNYIKRMSSIEEIAASFEGVKEAYCLSAGREIRIIVQPDKVDDLKAAALAKECARKIEENIDYPGEVKVTVIRSSRMTEVAK